MKFTSVYLSILAMLFFVSCSHKPKSQLRNDTYSYDTLGISYAKGFRILQNARHKKIQVENPWQHAQGVLYEYEVNSDAAKLYAFNSKLTRVICFSTTHLAFIASIGEAESVVGVANAAMVNNQQVLTNIENGKTRDIGNEQALDYEQILNLKPDAIFAYGVGAEVQATYQKFADWGIPVILIAEYLENTPLGKAEWIKFFGVLYGKEKIADSIFSAIEMRYAYLSNFTKKLSDKPVVLTSMPWKDVWYVPGGNSFMSHFIADAGGNYLWADNASRESLSLSIEEVFHKASNADLWIHTGMATDLDDIKKADPRMQNLQPYINQQVYNNNKRQNTNGGNDFWESGTINPHVLLEDLINIFHPGLLEKEGLYYYQKLE